MQYNEAIKNSMTGTIWVTGCQSWYIDKHGNPAMYPWSLHKFREEMDHPQLAEFKIRAPEGVPGGSEKLAA